MIRILKIMLVVNFAFWVGLSAQTKINVVTRTIEKTFDFKPKTNLVINGEKANIKVTQSADNKIRIKIMLISKNPKLNLAENDIQYCDVTINKNDDRIEIANIFTDKAGYRNITSNLGAKFEIEVPNNIKLDIMNVYGNIDIRKVDAVISVNSSYGQLSIEDISGFTKIVSYYCDIKGNTINSNITISAQQADIVLKNINNDCNISNKYGIIDCELSDSKFTNISGNMTKINLSIPKIENYSIQLEAIDADIIVPGALSKYISRKNSTNRFIYSNGKSIIKAKTNYNAVTLNTR